MFIISGSSLSMMENDVLGYRSPLYGRNINSWKLSPFSFSVILKLFNNMEDAFKIWSVFGSVPYYILFYDRKKNLVDNIRIKILTKGINLYDEPLVLLRQEFRESRVYRLILKYISLGYVTIGKLCSITGIDKSNISKYLSTLEELNLIRHILPLGKKRKGIYQIYDPFLDFWFKFVYPNKSDLEIGNFGKVLSIFNREKNSFFGKRFELLIEWLLKERVFNELSNFCEVYKWWHKDKEIDIVALNENKKEILFCECKWKSNVNAEKILKDLKEKAKYVDWNKEQRKERYCIFAKSFKKKIKEKNVYLFDLNDIKKVLKKNS